MEEMIKKILEEVILKNWIEAKLLKKNENMKDKQFKLTQVENCN